DGAAAAKSGGVIAARNSLTQQGQQVVKENRMAVEKMKCGLHTPEGFKKALQMRCGSLWGAWREALDLDGNGRLTFGEFCVALHRLAFHGE
ncbi:unnamed protein product, partial [Polarella glacialis]